MIWFSVTIMMAAFGLGAAAVVMLSWWWAIAALAVFAAGVCLAERGHIMRDTHTSVSLRREVAEVRHPAERPMHGADPHDIRHVATGEQRQVHPEPARPSARDLAHAWGFALLLLGVWLLIAPSLLGYPTEIRSGVDGRWRDITAGSILILTGLWTVRADRPNKLALAAAAAAAVILVVITQTTTVPTTAMRVNELLCGALVVICASLHGLYARQWQDRLRRVPGPHPEHKPH
jgi:hypothetical protein